VNTSDFRCTGSGSEVRIGLQFVKGLSAEGAERILAARGGTAERRNGGSALAPSRPRAFTPFRSIFDLQHRIGIAADDLRALIRVGALDSIADGWTRPMMLWMVDGRNGGTAERRNGGTFRRSAVPPWFDSLPPAVPVLRDYGPERRRREEYAALGFVTDTHPMRLHDEGLACFRLCRSTELHRHVGRYVLAAGMLTTAKPVHTLRDEPMEFATFDDGDGLIEAVLFPDVYRELGHVLFDQGPFIFRGKVEEEFGAVTLTITHLDRLDRAVQRRSAHPPPKTI
jgi:DNA polymerase III alpha subunit